MEGRMGESAKLRKAARGTSGENTRAGGTTNGGASLKGPHGRPCHRKTSC